MDDKELVEVWQKQFEDWYRSIYMNSPVERDSDSYVHAHISSQWNAWIAAKRSQPSVVLPDSDDYVYKCGYESSVHDALTAAGIKYTIGE